jgi:hypothetical protein
MQHAVLIPSAGHGSIKDARHSTTRATVRSARAVVALLLLAGCVEKQPAPAATDSVDLRVSVGRGWIDAPDTLKPGWTRMRVSEDGAGHIVVLFRLPPAATDADVASFLAALDTASMTPAPGVAMGGPEIGDIGDVIVNFAPGRYVFGCVSRLDDRHRHVSNRESKSVLVQQGTPDSAHAAAPRETQRLSMADFAYTGPEKWAAGEQLIRVDNAGHQDHQLRLMRLKDGTSVADWMNAENPGSLGADIAGVARMGPGEVAYLPVSLTPGTYVAYCLVTDPKTRKAHVELGMVRSIQVE